ncbi:MAG: 50S ribosomal protein L9 [Candidatus Latescibacteria bacterium]|jgi:large subunit ribosomal protein L9|nr:50S ribosomal protein L9 [Candidatus Latescibacterota bacterium]MBT5832865.1 50S ribosomal protein L9 [Candidatus Latescibacterota bacterium]
MKVILTEDVDRLGNAGEIVAVKHGFARNFLLPRQLALIANKGNMAVYKEVRRQRDVQQSRAKREAEVLAAALAKVSCNVPVTVGEGDRIFGSVTAQQIVDLLKEQGFDIDRRAVQLDEPIRALGVYDVTLRLLADVDAKVKVWVVKE